MQKQLRRAAHRLAEHPYSSFGPVHWLKLTSLQKYKRPCRPRRTLHESNEFAAGHQMTWSLRRTSSDTLLLPPCVAAQFWEKRAIPSGCLPTSIYRVPFDNRYNIAIQRQRSVTGRLMLGSTLASEQLTEFLQFWLLRTFFDASHKLVKSVRCDNASMRTTVAWLWMHRKASMPILDCPLCTECDNAPDRRSRSHGIYSTTSLEHVSALRLCLW